ncbi:MAG: type I-U CRISPR-associated protein Cas7 [Phycisphaerae bacterium]|nr:type I-U CRISPR-associated protein Cas7 [Phycisphaerae bacterium]
MSESLSLKSLIDAVQGTGAALRSCTRLQPAGGEGTKVFPPTYEGSAYAVEKRRVCRGESQSEIVDCVLLDSVQSQANRMEEALQLAIDSGRLEKSGVTIPLVEVDFTSFHPGDGKPEEMRLLDPVGTVSSLQAPHRIADAILRDSNCDGVPFRQSDMGMAVSRASLRDATALLGLCPTALLFGMWDSTGPKGGLGAKFERALVSEIVGINAVFGLKTSSRIDPLGIQLKAGPLYKASDDNKTSWTLAEANAKREGQKALLLGKDGRPSEANHGNITPSLSDRDPRTNEYLAGGATIEYAEQTTVLSLPALRRLRFPVDGEFDAQVETMARTVLTALGLTAATLAAENGLDLRSRCLLWSSEPLSWELLGRPGEAPKRFTLDPDSAIALLKESTNEAKRLGLPWMETPLVLVPSDELVQLVVRSQRLAMQQGGDN